MYWTIIRQFAKWSNLFPQIFCFFICSGLSSLKGQQKNQRTLTYFLRGSITVWLTKCLTGLDLAKQVNLLLIKHKQNSWNQTCQTWGQWYFPLQSECSLKELFSPGLVVMGGDSWVRIPAPYTGWTFFHTVRICCKKFVVVWKDENKWKRGRGWPNF